MWSIVIPVIVAMIQQFPNLAAIINIQAAKDVVPADQLDALEKTHAAAQAQLEADAA